MAISRGVVVSGIGFSQIIAWGSTYNLPAILAEQITLETGWSQTWVIAGLSVGLLVAALISPLVGRTINHKGGRTVLPLSAIAIGMRHPAELYWRSQTFVESPMCKTKGPLA